MQSNQGPPYDVPGAPGAGGSVIAGGSLPVVVSLRARGLASFSTVLFFKVRILPVFASLSSCLTRCVRLGLCTWHRARPWCAPFVLQWSYHIINLFQVSMKHAYSITPVQQARRSSLMSPCCLARMCAPSDLHSLQEFADMLLSFALSCYLLSWTSWCSLLITVIAIASNMTANQSTKDISIFGECGLRTL